MLKFLQRLAFDFPGNFSRDLILTDTCIENLKKVVVGLLAHETPSIFFSRVLRSEAFVYNSCFF